MLLLWVAAVTACACVQFVVSQHVSGCPSYGCTPTGSFSLLTPSGIPRSGVKVVWTTQLSNSSGTGSRLLGCVSNDRHVVCPSQYGYVGIDADTGRVLWKDSSLINPSLPIMDINGDIIGSDGRYLTKVDGNGNVEKPVIPLDPLMTPVYSIVFGDENILFIVSQTGELVAYLANGIPLASLVLRGNVERYNGTFHPIAQPIMKGSRAYILTQFKPDPQEAAIPQEKIVRMQRLYSVDIRVSELERMRVVWSVNIGTGRTALASDNDDIDGGSVLLYYLSTIYISLSGVGGDAVSTLLAVREDGSKGTIVYTTRYPPSDFAIYDDVTFCHEDTVQMPVVWVAQQRGSVISALDPKTNIMFMNITLNTLLNVKHVRLSSKLMVHKDTADRFVLMIALSVANTTAERYSQHLVTLKGVLSSKKAPTVMWSTPLPDSFQVKGQISFVSGSSETFVATARNMTGLGTLALQRLYAMDILDRMVKPIDIVWYLNLELEVKVNYQKPVKSQYEPKQTSKDIDGSKQRPIASISRGEAVKPRNPDKMNLSRLSRNTHAPLEHDTRLKYKAADREQRNSIVLDMLTRSKAKGGKSIREPTNSLRNPAHRHDVSSDVVEMVQHESIQFIGTGNTNKYQNPDTPGTGNTNSGTSGTGDPQKDRHPPSNIRHQWSQQASEQSSLSYFFGTVMASVAPPIGICDMLTLEEHRQSCLESSFSRLVGIQDLGTNMSLLYSNNFSLSHMSVYDSSYGRMGLDSSRNTSIKQEIQNADPKHDKTQATHTQQRTRLGEGSLVWAVTQFGDTINGFDQISSQVQQIANVSQMLNTTVQVTSRVMVALDPKTHADLLLFAVRRVNKTEPHSSFNATNYLVALDTSFGDGQANIMWTFPVPYDYEVQGQIAVLEVPWVNSTSPLLVATAQGPVSQIAFAFNFTQIL